MIPFDATELTGLLEFLRDCPGRVAAAVVPGAAGREVLIARLRDALPELRLEIADDTATPGQLGARARALGRDEDSLFVIAVDGRRLDTEVARVDFWRRLNYQRERLASGAVRTCLVLDAKNERTLAMVADDLWDWAMVFRFPEAISDVAPAEHPGADVNAEPDLEVELQALRSRWQRAVAVDLPRDQISRDFGAPLLMKLAAAGVRKDPELLASALAVLAYEVAPYRGSDVSPAVLENVAGGGASLAAEALKLLQPRIEAKKTAKDILQMLASGAQGLKAVTAVEALERSIFGVLRENAELATQLGTMIERIGGLSTNTAQDIGWNPRTVDDARDAYLSRVMARTGFVALGGVDPALGHERDRRLHLDAVYTALRTRTPRRAEDESHMVHGPGRHIVTEHEETPLSALEQLDRHARLILLGEPGSGKSTFATFVALCLAGELLGNEGANLKLLTAPLAQDDGSDAEEREPWSHGALLPVQVALRDFAARRLSAEVERPTAEHLRAFLESDLRDAQLEEFRPALEEALQKGQALVLLDGLDEVPEATGRRAQMCNALEHFVRTYPANRYLVTSRHYAQQHFRLADFAVAELAPFSDGQIRRFVQRWYRDLAELRGLRPEEARGRARLLERAIFSSSSLRELASRPLLLTLMVSLHALRGGRLPEDREKLYDDAVELLLNSWEQARHVRDASGELMLEEPSLTEWLQVDRRDVLRVLQALAYEAQARQPDLAGTADIAAGELVARLMELPAKIGADVDPGKLASYLSQRTGILVKRGERVYAFPHRTFQEYLAARHLVDGGFDYDRIARDARRDPIRWREVVLLAAARIGPLGVWELADALALEDDPPEPAEDAWGLHLAGHVVAESANLEPVSSRDRRRLEGLRRRLSTLLASATLPAPERAVAGANLARIGDPRFDPEAWFLPADAMAGFVAIPGGEYTIGNDSDRQPHAPHSEQPGHTVRLSSFWLARWPVTVAQLGAFVEAAGFEIRDRHALADIANHPVVWVSWDEAAAYCDWLTGRLRELAPGQSDTAPDGDGFWRRIAAGELRAALPTEAQWEAAARGPDGRIYPWGDAPPDGETANFAQTIGGPTTVGIYPRGRGPFGTEDQAGNVAEWCADVWDENAYYLKPGSAPPVDPISPFTEACPLKPGSAPLESPDPSQGSEVRAVRGGSWWDGPIFLRAASRFGWSAGYRSWFRGFRVCLSAREG